MLHPQWCGALVERCAPLLMLAGAWHHCAGTVRSVGRWRAWIDIDAPARADECRGCMRCTTSGTQLAVPRRASPEGLESGDRVSVRIYRPAVLLTASLVFGVPVALAALAMWAGHGVAGEKGAFAGSALGLALGVALCAAVSARLPRPVVALDSSNQTCIHHTNPPDTAPTNHTPSSDRSTPAFSASRNRPKGS